jgi:hypothetical protein
MAWWVQVVCNKQWWLPSNGYQKTIANFNSVLVRNGREEIWHNTAVNTHHHSEVCEKSIFQESLNTLLIFHLLWSTPP